jgi:hypothetical protein
MKSNSWLRLLALLLVLFFLNSCGGGYDGDAPAATSPPSSIDSESSHLVRPTPANPEEKVEPTRATSAETAAQLNEANSGPQTSGSDEDEPIHRNSHRLYLMVVIRR